MRMHLTLWLAAWATLTPAASAQTTVERVATIGSESGQPETAFGRVADVAFGPDSAIYVLDSMNDEVRVFGLDGRFLRRFGREGKGPGEFSVPTGLMLTPSEVRVFDPQQQRVVVFTHGGRAVRTFRIPGADLGLDVAIPMRYGWWLGAKTIISTPREVVSLIHAGAREVARRGPTARRRQHQYVAAFREHGSALDTLLTFDPGAVEYIIPDRGYGFFSGWGPGGSWAVAGDSLVALVDAYRGRIRVLAVTPDGFRLERSIQIDASPRPLSNDDWKSAEARARNRGRNIPPKVYLIGPPFAPQLGQAVFADDGTLWIRRVSAEGTGPEGLLEFVVVPPGGSAKTLVNLPVRFGVRAILGDLVLGWSTTPLGVPVVQVIKVRLGRPPTGQRRPPLDPAEEVQELRLASGAELDELSQEPGRHDAPDPGRDAAL